MGRFVKKCGQKWLMLMVLLGVCRVALASNFTALPATLTIYLGLPSLIVVGLILFILSRLEITKFAKILGFILLIIAILINLPLIYLDSVSGYKIATTIANKGECFYETELRLCHGILWFYGMYSLILLAFSYCIYRFIKQCYPPKLPDLPLMKDL